KERILIADRVDRTLAEELERRGFEVLYSPGISREKLLEEIEKFDAVVVRSRTKIDAEVIKKGKNLKLIARAGVGVDNIDVEEAAARKIEIITSPAAPAVSVAELTVALMLVLARKINTAMQFTREGRWEKVEGIELRGKVAGIIGIGRIGREVARLCRCLGMEVIAYDVRKEALNELHGIKLADSLEDLLRSSDIVTLHVPLTKETHRLIGKREIFLMKNGALLINTSRGSIVDQEALLEALKVGKLGGAALDVLEREPPGELEMELIKHPNVVVTPHIGSQTVEAQRRIALEIAEAIERKLRRVEE
ncbi:MAG: NAD(P)-dependent oxidoreductase, partial [Fervidicoccaceae archaeon]